MDRFYSQGMSREQWIMSSQTVVNYNNQPSIVNQRPSYTPHSTNTTASSVSNSSLKPLIQDVSEKYNPFVDDIVDEDIMEISDDEENQSLNSNLPVKVTNEPEQKLEFTTIKDNLEIKSGTAFYKGLILYIPPFEQLSHSYRGSPALKMLYASFEFSFKSPLKIETKSRENDPNITDATVYFRDQVICTASGFSPPVEASVRALELLSETCYTIQAKEDYFLKCKVVDGENMKTLNIKKWEALREKYPKISEVTQISHIQKTFAVFLDNHTSSGEFEDIVCSNLTRQDVNHLKSVVEFFHLTMLPCSIPTKLSKKNTPCVISIHKYTSAKKLLDILVECGGENDKFRIYPPDTFKDFYKLHPNYWDQNLKKQQNNKIEESKTTLDDPELQNAIMTPYKNMIADLFVKYKSLQKIDKPDDTELRKAGDDFMKDNLQIDMNHSKTKAPVERMQLLLKYMEQLQEYGSRVLPTGRQEMIKIYHHAIDNVRKDLEECRKDLEKEQKEKDSAVSKKSSSRTRSPVQRRRTPTRRRSKSPVSRDRGGYSRNRSVSPRHRVRSRSPKRNEKPLRSQSPRRRPRSKSPRRLRPNSPRRQKSKSPRRQRSKSPRRPRSKSPRTLRSKSPVRPRSKSPRRRAQSPSARYSKQSSTCNQSRENQISSAVFQDQFRRFVDILRRFRIEIEDTPMANRSSLREKFLRCEDQLNKFFRDFEENPLELARYLDEMEICREELKVQDDLIRGIPQPNNMQASTAPPQWIDTNTPNFNNPVMSTAYPLPNLRLRNSGYAPNPLPDPILQNNVFAVPNPPPDPRLQNRYAPPKQSAYPPTYNTPF